MWPPRQREKFLLAAAVAQKSDRMLNHTNAAVDEAAERMQVFSQNQIQQTKILIVSTVGDKNRTKVFKSGKQSKISQIVC